MCGFFKYKGLAIFTVFGDFLSSWTAACPKESFCKRWSSTVVAVCSLLLVAQVMALAIVTPTRSPVKGPGPLMTKTFCRSFHVAPDFLSKLVIAGIIFAASSRLLGQDFSARILPLSMRATADVSEAELMATVNMGRVEYGSIIG